MTLKDWIKDNIVGFGYCAFKDRAIEGLMVIGTCVGCKHWESDMDFCSLRDELDWDKDDGCIRWKKK